VEEEDVGLEEREEKIMFLEHHKTLLYTPT
jgi:hypothetical protein